jgi:hypothetical protein
VYGNAAESIKKRLGASNTSLPSLTFHPFDWEDEGILVLLNSTAAHLQTEPVLFVFKTPVTEIQLSVTLNFNFRFVIAGVMKLTIRFMI